MRSFCTVLLIIASLVAPAASVLGQTPERPSVVQLKDEIRRLVAVDHDANTTAEVRVVNQIFIKKRRAQLRALLEQNIDGLRRYLSTVEPSLTPEEKLIVQNTIAQAERDLQSLREEPGASTSDELAVHPAPLPELVNATANADRSREVSGENGNGNGNGSGNGPGISSFSSSPVTTTALSNNATAAQPQGSTSLNADLNARIKAKAQTLSKTRVDQTDNTKQTEAPSVAGGSGSLVDQSSASDLIGLAANFAGLSASSNDDQPEVSSVSVTASAYSLLAAIKRVDPLNPVFYDHNRNWRKFSITLGYDDEDQTDGTKQRAKLFGAKFMFINRRDPGLKRNQQYIERVGNSLEEAAKAFGDIAVRVRAFVMSLETVRRDLITPGFKNFLEQKRQQIELDLEKAKRDQKDVTHIEERLKKVDELLANPARPDLFVFGPNSLPTATWSREELEYRTQFENEFLGANYRDKLSKPVVDGIDEFLDRTLDAVELKEFTNLNDVTRDAVERIRRAPQLSLSFLTKQRRFGLDEYLGELIFDYGVANRVNLTLNGAYRYNDTKIIGGDVRGFSFSGQLRFQLNRENLLGKKPLFFDVATQGSWMNGVDSIYKTQGKLTIPIADGIDFPISVTYANRTELIKEKEVRGQFGFTIDTARLIRAFIFR